MFDLYSHIETMAKEHGFKNVTELCKAAGVPRSNMTELKKGRSKSITIENAAKFARVFGVSIDDVLGESLHLLSANFITPAAKSDGLDEVMDFLRSLPVARLRGILLALEAPAEVIAALDRSEPPK